MSTQQRQEHFAGFARSGHATPSQFRPVVKALLADERVSSATSSAWYSGVGGRPVWKQVRTDKGLYLTCQANGLRMHFVVFTEDPVGVAQGLVDSLGFEPLPVEKARAAPAPASDTGPDLSWAASDLGTGPAGALRVLVALADPYTGKAPFGRTAAEKKITKARRGSVDAAATARDLDSLCAAGRVEADTSETRVLQPLDPDGALALPPLPGTEPVPEFVAADPPLPDDDIGDWAQRKAQEYAGADVPVFCRPWLPAALADAAAEHRRDQQRAEEENASDAAQEDRAAGWTASRLREAVRHAPAVLAAARADAARARSRADAVEAVVGALQEQAAALADEADQDAAAVAVLALMHEAVREHALQEAR